MIDEDIQGVMRTVVSEVIVEPTKENIQGDMQSAVHSSRKVKKSEPSRNNEPKKKVRHSLNIIK